MQERSEQDLNSRPPAVPSSTDLIEIFNSADVRAAFLREMSEVRKVLKVAAAAAAGSPSAALAPRAESRAFPDRMEEEEAPWSAPGPRLTTTTVQRNMGPELEEEQEAGLVPAAPMQQRLRPSGEAQKTLLRQPVDSCSGRPVPCNGSVTPVLVRSPEQAAAPRAQDAQSQEY